MGLPRCEKLAVYYIYIYCFSISIHSWDTTTSAFRKQTDGQVEILLPVSILTHLLPSACGFPSAYQISSKSDYHFHI